MSRLPLRARLVAGFAAAMVNVLLAAGAFVWWRVQYALDHRLDQDLASQVDDLRDIARSQPPGAAIAALHDEGRRAQLLTPQGTVLASGQAIPDGHALLDAAEARRAAAGALRTGRGYLFSARGRHLRIRAFPVQRENATLIGAVAVNLDQRDEALRELLAQLAIANLLALALASLVGYRLARAALDPVERYRARADAIAHGATGVRLDVPPAPDDEITRLGTTLNTMLDAQERASERQRQFIDDASHELRTPLTTLAAELDVARRKPRTADEYAATLDRLAATTATLIDLTDALLALGALGSTVPTARELPAADALNLAAERARRQLTDGRKVTVDAAHETVLHADPHLLERALGNLVDNAVRYGQGTVALTAAPAPNATIVTVHDQGPGIPPDFLAGATERFRQYERARSSPGVGLGLALVDAIITAHGGQLRICSAGHHHHQPTTDRGLAALPCAHRDTGTSVTLVLRAREGRVNARSAPH